MGFGQNSFSTPFAVLVWLSQFWNGIFISNDGFHVRVRNLCIFHFTTLTAINEKKRQAVLYFELLAVLLI
ncbi:MAG: hypothetical protein SOZ34_08130 [Clostridia bacterium]|nr:hypothetical protein [Clostridia bacterium]